MKVLSVIRAESIRAVRRVSGDYGYWPTAVAAVVQEYGFLTQPTVEELSAAMTDPGKGLTFRGGTLETGGKRVAIDYLQIFSAGLSVATHSHSSESDFALEHIMNWSKSQFHFEFEELKQGIGHSSQLEVRLEASLAKLFPLLSTVGDMIKQGLDDWWGFKPPYELINLNFWFDKTEFPAFAPPIFRLDRRDNIPFEQEVYYSEAPMSTDSHVAVLDKLERVCLEGLNK
ncbi:MAG TPA: hypothetical protein VNF45_03650 [Candidatus Binataceae bacterium]|nr:hypothetical protein [Candidatus Binataceae bacterium]